MMDKKESTCVFTYILLEQLQTPLSTILVIITMLFQHIQWCITLLLYSYKKSVVYSCGNTLRLTL